MINSVVRNKQLKQLITSSCGTVALDELKTGLLINDNIEILNLLLKNILKEINSISYVKNSNDYNWILYCLKYVTIIISNDSDVYTLDILHKMEQIKDSLERKQKESKNKIPNNLKILYMKMHDIIKPLTKILSKKTLHLKQKEQEQISITNLYKFTSKLIFEIKNFDYFFQITKTYPDMINCTDENNLPIIFELIKKQIQNLKKKSNNQRILYFARVINYIINSHNFYLTENQLQLILKYLKNELINLSDEEKENIEFLEFINLTISNLKSKSKMTSIPQNIRDLYKKYKIEEIENDYLLDTIIKPKEDHLVDYTDKNVITMDFSNKVRIFDDAISCEVLPNGNYQIGIYIADVASLIPYGSELDLFAYNRAETVYMNEHVIDMLPLDLAYHCSLNTNGLKRVVAYTFEFTKDVELYDFKVENAIVEIKQNLTFYTGQKLYLSNYKANNHIGKMLKELINFNKKFSTSGFYNQNYHLFKQEMRKIEEIHEHHGDNDCSNVVSSLMILVNRSMAKFFEENGYPFLYRVNNSNIDEDLVRKIKNASTTQVLPNEIKKQIDKVYSRSKYSNINTGHNGLNLEHYCHSTNPIRNYASLFTQRMIIDEFIHGGIDDKLLIEYEKQIPIIAATLNSKIDLYDNFKEAYNKIQKRHTKK